MGPRWLASFLSAARRARCLPGGTSSCCTSDKRRSPTRCDTLARDICAMELILDHDVLRFELRDDGRGFNPAAPSEGAGLAGIRHRAAAMGGYVRIDSGNGGGTTVAITLPLPAHSGGG